MEIKLKKSDRKILVGLCVSFIGLFIFIFVRSLYCNFWFANIKYDQVVAPLNVLNLIVSAGIALWLGYYITKKLTEQRFIKEFIITDINKIEEELDNFKSIMSGNNVELETAFVSLNRLNHKIENVDKTAKLIDFSPNEIQEIKLLYYKLYRIATTTDSSTSIQTVNTRYSLEPIYSEFSHSLRTIVFLLNKN